jgi:hypothetical protein
MATEFFTPQAQYFNNKTATTTQAARLTHARPLAFHELETRMNSFEQFSLTPLTAGDIIDRAIRLYRQHFLVFLRIVLVPSLIAYAGGILWALGLRNFSFERGDQRLLLTVGMMATGGLLWIVGKALFLMLLGGASRGLVWHFFNGTPLSARAAFQAVRERWASLLSATLLISFLLLVVIFGAYVIISFALVIYFLLAAWLLSGLPNWVQILSHGLFGVTVITGGVLLLLFTYARVVYVPQALMVEGKSVGEAVTRSLRLANHEIRRIGALVLFQICVALSLYWLLMIPLGWYGYWHGVELDFFSTHTPLWFNIAQQTLAQIGEILLAPIILLGFTLLYLDTRVRNEGFDIELLANRILPLASTAEWGQSTPSQGILWAEPEPRAPVSSEKTSAAPALINTLEAAVSPAPGMRQPPLAQPSAFTPPAVTPPAREEATVTIPIQQPGEFSEVITLSATLSEPAVQTVNLNAASAEVAPMTLAARFCDNCGAPAADPLQATCPGCGAHS